MRGRTVSGYRSYSQADLEKVIFIKRSQQLGFTLKEIKELIALHASISKISKRKGGKSRESQQILSVAGGKIAQIDDKLSMLRAVKRQLLAMLTELERSADILFGLLRENLISQMSHAGYLGGELAKADQALRTSLVYEQDRPLRGFAPGD